MLQYLLVVGTALAFVASADYTSCGPDRSCPTLLYCQPWNPNQAQCRYLDNKCGKQEVDTDYNGDDLQKLQKNLPEECCDACFSTDGCVAYTFVNYNPDGKAYCYLKKGTGNKTKLVGAVSARIEKNPDRSGCGSDGKCPQGQYCQPWNPTQAQCLSLDPKCGSQDVDVDYYGNDIKTVQLAQPGQCCDACLSTDSCVAYTFVNENIDGKAYCYLKNATGTTQPLIGAVSAKVNKGGSNDGYIACGADRSCPSGLYCQPWNPNQAQCRSIDAKCGTQEVDMDYYGDDLQKLQVNLPEDCCNECFKNDQCLAYTFVNYNPDGKAYCYLKKGTGKKTKLVGAVSAQVQKSCSTKEGEWCGNASTGAKCCPDADVCMTWDVNYFSCLPKPAKCSKMTSQLDYNGDDIKTVFSISLSECCDTCSTTPDCKAFTYVNDNKLVQNAPACYLKKGTGTPQYHATAVSGVVN